MTVVSYERVSHAGVSAGPEPGLADLPRPVEVTIRAGTIDGMTRVGSETFVAKVGDVTPTHAADSESSVEFAARDFRAVLQRWRADAMLDPVGMFLLQKIALEEAGISSSILDLNLSGAQGWLPLARLLRAGLIDENGRIVYATGAGTLAAQFTASLAEQDRD